MYKTDKGNQSWIVFRKTDVEPGAPILWPPDAESRLIGKNLDTEKDWRQKEKGMTEDEMVSFNGWWLSLTQWTWVWENPGR